MQNLVKTFLCGIVLLFSMAIYARLNDLAFKRSVPLRHMDVNLLPQVFKALADANEITESIKPVVLFNQAHRIRKVSNSPYYVIEYSDSGVIHMLFNGHVAFLGSSHFYDKKNVKTTKGIYIHPNGEFEVFTQEDMILSNLPHQMKFSRCMSDSELNL